MRQRSEVQVIQVLDSTPPEMLGDPRLPPKTDGIRHKGAMRPDAEKEAAAPKPHYYRVTKGGRVLDPASGLRCEIRIGKELDDINYKIPMLISQGVKLEEIKEEERSIGGFTI